MKTPIEHESHAEMIAGADTSGAGVWAIVIILILGFAGFWVYGESQRQAELRTVHGRASHNTEEAKSIAQIKCRNLPAGPERNEWCRILRM